MSWLDLFRGGRKSAGTLELFREIYGRMWSTKVGRSVTLDSAMRVATIFACCRLIGNGHAQVPLKLMRESVDAKGRTTRLPAKDHTLYDVLALNPNPWQTSFEFRTQWSWHIELAGNFICFKNAPAGVVRELIPLDPMRMKITRLPDYSLKYELTSDDGATTREIPAESIFHVRGPSWNGWQGLQVLQLAREAIGLAIVTEESQASLHENGVRPSGVYSVEGKLTSDQYKELHKWIVREAGGAAKAGLPFLMDRSGKWISAQMTGVDAQHLETRNHQIAEMARFMGVLPIMVGYNDKAATYASAEQMFLAHLVHTLSPRWTAYEQALDKGLLTPSEREEGLYFDYVEEGMIRGSNKDTKDTILGYVNGGLMTPNEGRGKLDLNPDEDPASDELRIPVTTVQDPNAEPPADPATADNAKAIAELRGQVKTLLDRPPAPIHVDARTSIADGAIKVTTGATTVDATTSIQEGAVQLEAPVSVKTEVQPAAPVIKAYPSETEETITRDEKGEIKTVVRRAKE